MSGKKNGSGSSGLAVLYDGWALTHAPASPAAMHALALLAALPAEIHPLVAVPGPSAQLLAANVEIIRSPAGDTSPARLNWEQRVLPDLAQKHGASLLHLVSAGAPLASATPVIISPAEAWPVAAAHPRGLAARLRQALFYGASGTVKALLWPSDLPPPPGDAKILTLPPLAHPAFWGPPAWDSSLPDGYLLAAGALEPPALELLVEGWKWAGPAVGGSFPLVLAGLSAAQKDHLAALTGDWGLDETLRLLPASTLAERAALLGQATAVACLDDPLPWGDPLLEALAAGKPIIAPETELVSARVGPAAFTFPPLDARGLGAAMTTLLVQEDVAESLSLAARKRASAWDTAEFGPRLAEVYRRMVRM